MVQGLGLIVLAAVAVSTSGSRHCDGGTIAAFPEPTTVATLDLRAYVKADGSAGFVELQDGTNDSIGPIQEERNINRLAYPVDGTPVGGSNYAEGGTGIAFRSHDQATATDESSFAPDVGTGWVKKSQAQRVEAWRRRKLAQVLSGLPGGSGLKPWSRRIRLIVVRPIV